MTGLAKRMLAALVCVGLLLVSLPALAGAGVQTIYRQNVIGGDDSVRTVAYMDGTVYVFTWGRIYYTWTAASGELAAHPFDDLQFVRADGGYTNIQALIPAADGVYAVVVANDPVDGDGTEVGAVTLCPIEFAADGTATVGEGIALAWDDMVQEQGDYEYSRELNYPFLSGNSLVFATYPDGGDYPFFLYDTQSGDGQEVDADLGSDSLNITACCAYGDGTVLIMADNYDTDPAQVLFFTLDLSTGEVAQAASIDDGSVPEPVNLIYDEAADIAYFTSDGQLYRMTGLDPATVETVAVAPLNGWGGMMPVLTGDGSILLSDYQTVVLCDTDPAARAETTLTVNSQYNTAVESAYFTFSGRHPEADVVIATDYTDISDAMLSQSSAVDIYVSTVSGDDFGALYDRGYLADLSGSETLSALVGEMYPDIQAAVTKDGRLLALPVDLYVDGVMSYEPKAFEKLGFTEDDVPRSWMGMLQFLQRLPGLIGDTGVTVTEPYETGDDFRRDLFYALVHAYTLYLEKTPEAGMAFDTALFKGLVAEFEKIDFAGLGLPEEYDEDAQSENGTVLFELQSYLSADQVGADGMTPLVLAMDEGMVPMMETELTVAFVNPYSQNADLAVQYLEAVAENVDKTFLANACPDRNDPIPNPGYEETLAYLQGQLDAIRAELDKADEADKDEWQAQLDEQQGYYDDYTEDGAWSVSADSIARYRAYAQNLTVYTFFGLGDEEMSNIYDPMSQYLDGAIDAQTMCQTIDQKLKMMLAEGM